MRRIVAAPAFALHICFSFFMYFSHAHVPALDPRLLEDVAAFENFEVLSDCKKKISVFGVCFLTPSQRLSLYLQVCALKISGFEFYLEPFSLGQNNRNKNANVEVEQSQSSFGLNIIKW